MFFISLLLFLPVFSFLPWWSMGLVSLFSGAFMKAERGKGFSHALAGGCVWAGWAFVRDGQNFGLISRRLGGAFQLPFGSMIFVVVFVIAFLFAFLWFQAGASLRRLVETSPKLDPGN